MRVIFSLGKAAAALGIRPSDIVEATARDCRKCRRSMGAMALLFYRIPLYFGEYQRIGSLAPLLALQSSGIIAATQLELDQAALQQLDSASG
jgi:hypothetical protein